MLKIGCDSIVATFLTHTGHWLDVCQDGRAIYRVWQKSIPRKTAIGIFGILAMSYAVAAPDDKIRLCI